MLELLLGRWNTFPPRSQYIHVGFSLLMKSARYDMTEKNCDQKPCVDIFFIHSKAKRVIFQGFIVRTSKYHYQ